MLFFSRKALSLSSNSGYNSERHLLCFRENKYIPPGQRNRDVLSWGSGRQNSPRMGQAGSGPPISRSGSHTSDFSPNSGADQRVVNGGKYLC